MDVQHIVLRTVFSFLALFAFARLLGRKQRSPLSFFDFLTGVTLGSMAAAVTTNAAIGYGKGLLCLVVWCALTFAAGGLPLQSNRVRRRQSDGDPMVVIEHGRIVNRSLWSSRLTLNELSLLLRENHVFSTEDVDYAVLEPNGQLSVLQKPGKLNANQAEVGAPPTSLPLELIVDGKVIAKNLAELKLSRDWLNHRLKEAGLHSAADVFYAELLTDGTLHIDRRDDLVH